MCTLWASTSDAQGLAQATSSVNWNWSRLPPLPDPLGVAGAYVGTHNGALLVAGGANFAEPVWNHPKRWSDAIHVLVAEQDGTHSWLEGGTLHQPIGYGAAVSTSHGVLCIGGNDASSTYAEVFLLQWQPENRTVVRRELPALPVPLAYGQAALIDNTVYITGGQHDLGLESTVNSLWTLPLSAGGMRDSNDFNNLQWEQLEPCPGPTRAFNLTIAQHNGFDTCLYVISGRRQGENGVEFLRDVWEYNPRTQRWRQRQDAPRCVMAAAGIGMGQSHIWVLGGADGTLFHRTEELRDQHPGFPREALQYHTITDQWTTLGEIPANQVTTSAVHFGGGIVLASGELRPRVRTPDVWLIRTSTTSHQFGWINYTVLVVYLMSVIAIGVYFSRKNRDTESYFRGSKHVPWWAAGCSIFATMLSSLTFTGVPAKSYAQNWVYAVGNMMIPVVAFAAVFIALPFFRRIDATSAYEYLEHRFHRGVRLFGSASFTLFHVFRMAVVMSLTGLALAVATPLTPAQSVLLMGALSILYCTIGGVEAVIWTDTLQTVVLFGGAVFAIILLISGTEGGWSGFTELSISHDKLRVANLHWNARSSELALWVVIIGGIGQNISSYTADQAVVQRYMTTPDIRAAARSIWTNAVLTIPATALFFGIGTGLYTYYLSHPERLDPTITTDQIFPLFIARELPIGLAGLIVAGIFAAAQSTISTSMNSTATAIVTDFLRPAGLMGSERGYLRAGMAITMTSGALGTVLALLFISPQITSLFDTFITVIGLFMGVLGGLFVLGVMTKRANALGAMVGASVGAGGMFLLWKYSLVANYLFTACGIGSCVVVGYLVSLLTGSSRRDLSGLTIHTLERRSR